MNVWKQIKHAVNSVFLKGISLDKMFTGNEEISINSPLYVGSGVTPTINFPVSDDDIIEKTIRVEANGSFTVLIQHGSRFLWSNTDQKHITAEDVVLTVYRNGVFENDYYSSGTASPDRISIDAKKGDVFTLIARAGQTYNDAYSKVAAFAIYAQTSINKYILKI